MSDDKDKRHASQQREMYLQNEAAIIRKNLSWVSNKELLKLLEMP